VLLSEGGGILGGRDCEGPRKKTARTKKGTLKRKTRGKQTTGAHWRKVEKEEKGKEKSLIGVGDI